MKGRTYPSPSAIYPKFPDLKTLPIYCWVEREFSGRELTQTGIRAHDLKHHNRASLAARPWRLSNHFGELYLRSNVLHSPVCVVVFEVLSGTCCEG